MTSKAWDSFDDSEYEPSLQEDDDSSVLSKDSSDKVDTESSDMESSAERTIDSANEREKGTPLQKKTALASFSQRILGFLYEAPSEVAETSAKAIFLRRRKIRTKRQNVHKTKLSSHSEKTKRKRKWTSGTDANPATYVPTWLSTRTTSNFNDPITSATEDTTRSHLRKTRRFEPVIEIESKGSEDPFQMSSEDEECDISLSSKRRRITSISMTPNTKDKKTTTEESDKMKYVFCSPIVLSPLRIPETPPSRYEITPDLTSPTPTPDDINTSLRDNRLQRNDENALNESVDISELLLSSTNSTPLPPPTQRKRLRNMAAIESLSTPQPSTCLNRPFIHCNDKLPNDSESYNEREVPSETLDAILKLKAMGFEDIPRCLEVLKRHHNDIELAINDLLLTDVNNVHTKPRKSEEDMTFETATPNSISNSDKKRQNNKIFYIIPKENDDNNDNDEANRRMESLPISCRTRRKRRLHMFSPVVDPKETKCNERSQSEQEISNLSDDRQDYEVSKANNNRPENQKRNSLEESTQSLEELIKKCEEYSGKLQNLLQMNSQLQCEGVKDELHLLPHSLKNALKDYQRFGVRWLLLLYQEQLNGILADEMGLGKTIQTIAFLSLLSHIGDHGPHLIVVPSSTLTNWANEFRRWTPTLRIQLYRGSIDERLDIQQTLRSSLKRQRYDVSVENSDEERLHSHCHFNSSSKFPFDVLLTTYQLILQSHDRNFLRKIPFSYLILDEAQNIKNKFSLRYKILFKLNTKHRLLLTGTPLQNNLAELWALLYFLMPQLFTSPSLRDYKTAFPQLQKSKKQNRCGDSHLVPNEAEYIQRIRKILSPFILRRLKSTVSLDLKPKIEKILFCKMTAVQQQQYEITYSMSKTVWLQHLQQQQQQQQQQQPQVLEEVKNKRKFIVDSDNEFAIHDDSCETSIISIPNCNVTTSSNKIHSDYNNKSLGVIFYNILMRLRKIANHPLLIRGRYTDTKIYHIAEILKSSYVDYQNNSVDDIFMELKTCSDYQLHCLCNEYPKLRQWALCQNDIIDSCGKFQVLKQLLPQIHREGHKVLIFSQMTKMLDILEEFMRFFGFEFLRLDGQTPVSERQFLIDSFNLNPNIFVFLLSTRAGGLGINLTAADTVIFYDISFNPYVDRQAEDRCHRLGQEKQVVIYKLITCNTCEEHILKMASDKKQLNNKILDDLNNSPTAFVAEPTVQKECILQNECQQILQNLFGAPTQKNGDKHDNTDVDIQIEHVESNSNRQNNANRQKGREIRRSWPITEESSSEHSRKDIVIELSSEEE